MLHIVSMPLFRVEIPYIRSVVTYVEASNRDEVLDFIEDNPEFVLQHVVEDNNAIDWDEGVAIGGGGAGFAASFVLQDGEPV